MTRGAADWRRPARLLGVVAALALLAALVVPRLDVRLDLSFFLPDDPPPEASLLVDRLRGGAGAAIVMADIAGAPPERLAEASDSMAKALRDSGLFSTVANGRPGTLFEDLVADLAPYRYLLTPKRDGEFTAAGLRAAIQSRLTELTTSEGWLFRDLLPRDPTGRMQALLDSLDRSDAPTRRHGVWMTEDGDRALILARASAPTGDLAAQARVAEAVEAAAEQLEAKGLSVRASGPGLLAVEASKIMRTEMQLLSVVGSVLLATIVLAAFRAPSFLVTLGLPLAAAVLVGAAAVQGLFGHVHAVALAFASALMGVAIDYPLHLAVHARPGASAREAARQVTRPLALSAVTTIGGFAAMAQAGLPGLAQLGTLAAVGLVAAFAVSRWVVPDLLPPPREDAALARRWNRGLARAGGLRRLRLAALTLAGALLAAAWLNPAPLWETDLAALSPLSEEARAVDQSLRTAIGAPDARMMLVVRGTTAEAVLRRQETLRPRLLDLVAEGHVDGVSMAADLLPSVATQRARQEALPEPPRLRSALAEATMGLPMKAETFSPFVAAVEAQRTAAVLTPDTLPEGPLRWRLSPLLIAENQGWSGLILLSGQPDGPALAALADAAGPDVYFLDLRVQASALVNGYRDEALRWLLIAFVAGLTVLAVGLRRPGAVLRVALPAALAVTVSLAAVAAVGVPLTLFHLLSALLVAGIGVDYALFFTGYSSPPGARWRSFRGIILCGFSTLAVFAILGLSSVPTLGSIGATVAPGTLAALIFTMIFAADDI